VICDELSIVELMTKSNETRRDRRRVYSERSMTAFGTVCATVGFQKLQRQPQIDTTGKAKKTVPNGAACQLSREGEFIRVRLSRNNKPFIHCTRYDICSSKGRFGGTRSPSWKPPLRWSSFRDLPPASTTKMPVAGFW